MIRHLLLSVPLLVLLAMAASGGAMASEPTTTPEASNEEVPDQLAAACVAHPGASIRFFNPLAPDAYTDVACSTILEGDQSLGQTSEALTSGGENVGQAQQAFGPIAAVSCLAGPAVVWLGTRYGICKAGRTEQDRTIGGDIGSWGAFGLSVLCFIIIPF